MWKRAVILLLVVMGLLRQTYAEEHRVTWTIEGVMAYVENPLAVRFGDTVKFVCSESVYSNVIYVETYSQYEECNTSIADGYSRRIGECVGIYSVDSFSEQIQRVSGDVNSNRIIDYRAGEQYYLFSASTGSLLSTRNDMGGGQCLEGLKMVISVLPPEEDEDDAEYFVIAFSRASLPELQLFVTTMESEPVPFSVETLRGFNFSGVVNISTAVTIDLPDSFHVMSSSERDKGIRVSAGDKHIAVYGLTYNQGTAGAFSMLPCSIQNVSEYEYYGASYEYRTGSQVLFVACEDSTTVRIGSEVIRLNQMETYLYAPPYTELTGIRVVSDKPISFFSGHTCTLIPPGTGYCDHIVEQLPNTALWGKWFLSASLHGRTTDDIYGIVFSSPGTIVTFACTGLNLVTINQSANNHETVIIPNNTCCAIESNNPILVVQYASSYQPDTNNIGDSFMMTLPSIEQYSNNYAVIVPSQFPVSVVAIYVPPEYFQPEKIFVNEINQRDANWATIPCANQTTCGYAAYISVGAGKYSVYHHNAYARIGVSVYGFENAFGYGYPAVGALRSVPIQGTQNQFPGVCGLVGNLRLTPGPSTGTLQICKNNGWNNVCSTDWGNLDAAAACRQLGYDGGYTQSTSVFGATTDPVGYRCTGRETTLQACNSHILSSCTRGVSLVCVHASATDPCTTGDIRLWGGRREGEGNIELCNGHGVWSAVYDNNWDSPDASVACRQLNYTNFIQFVGRFGQRIQPAEYGGMVCQGRESSLQQCRIFESFVQTLSHLSTSNQRNYAGVRCIDKGESVCTHGDVRLVHGFSENIGLAEICIDGAWIGVCSYSQYRQRYASLICRQLNYTRYTIITDQGFFQSTGSRNEPLGYTSDIYCRSASAAVLIDCVRDDRPMRYTASCPQLGVLCCPTDTSSCYVTNPPTTESPTTLTTPPTTESPETVATPPRTESPATVGTPPTTESPTTVATPTRTVISTTQTSETAATTVTGSDAAAGFSLSFGEAATLLIESLSRDLRGVEEDIKTRIVDGISEECNCLFGIADIKDGFFSFGVNSKYSGKISSVENHSAAKLVLMLKTSIDKDPLIYLRIANVYLEVKTLLLYT